jgi:hypothetical protein
MAHKFGRIFFILAFFVLGIMPVASQPARAGRHAEIIDLKQNVAIMLTCKGNCYRNYEACLRQGQTAVHTAYCKDTYNWCVSHCH